MMKAGCILLLAVGLAISGCGKQGDLSLPSGVDSLPPDPSKRSDPPA